MSVASARINEDTRGDKMKNEEKDKINKALDILSDVDLGLPWVWMWTWGTIKYFMKDLEWKFTATEDEVWDALIMSTTLNEEEFTLQYGTETHYEIVQHWLIQNEFMIEVEDN
jgi:hypothetical protein